MSDRFSVQRLFIFLFDSVFLPFGPCKKDVKGCKGCTNVLIAATSFVFRWSTRTASFFPALFPPLPPPPPPHLHSVWSSLFFIVSSTPSGRKKPVSGTGLARRSMKVYRIVRFWIIIFAPSSDIVDASQFPRFQRPRLRLVSFHPVNGHLITATCFERLATTVNTKTLE